MRYMAGKYCMCIPALGQAVTEVKEGMLPDLIMSEQSVIL
uniref:Uncharacterized protein n=1 Tax=Anguilla anguilla TaxID=7936 RepID=A0A0E9WKL4_ANGAN